MRKATYYYGPQNAPSYEHDEFVSVPERYIPSIVEAIEARKTTGVFEPGVTFETGYNALCKAQWELLNMQGELIRRAIFYQMGYPRDVVLADDGFPAVELPEATLFAIRTRLGDPGDATLYSRLEAIRQLLEAQGVSEGGQLDALLQIVALLIPVA